MSVVLSCERCTLAAGGMKSSGPIFVIDFPWTIQSVFTRFYYMRGIGVGVEGVAGIDAIVAQ